MVEKMTTKEENRLRAAVVEYLGAQIEFTNKVTGFLKSRFPSHELVQPALELNERANDILSLIEPDEKG